MTDLARDLRNVLEERWRSADIEDPFLPALLRWRARVDPGGGPLPQGAAVLEGWTRRRLGDPHGPDRYPWEIPSARFHPDAIDAWREWDSELKDEARERWAAGFWLPAVLGDTFEWLEALVPRDRSGALDDARATAASRDAEALIRRVRRRVDDDLARRVSELEPWAGTFALSVFASRPRTLERFHPILTAMLMRFVADADEDGKLVLGRRFPLRGVPLVGPAAQLGRGEVAIGEGLEQLGTIVKFLRESQRHDGGWGEVGFATDLMTTLAAASFLASVDPDFDPVSPFSAMAASPEAAREWAAMDPRDGAFVASELAAYVDAAMLPFAERFRWPHVPSWLLDAHSGLPRFGAFQKLATLLGSIAGLERTRFEVAFLDLANFGAWNKRFGQDAGDEVLRFFGEVLREIPRSRVIQDGGDEILLVGAPGRRGLLEDLRGHFSGSDGSAGWPHRFAGRFPGTWCVPARAVVAHGNGAELMSLRSLGGKLIEALKRGYGSEPPSTGVFLSAEEALELLRRLDDEERASR